MTGFDPDDYGGYDGEDDEMYAVDNAYHEADRMNRPMELLVDVYNKYQGHTLLADSVANDPEALEWLDDYWAYVKWMEHGNEASIEEVGGFEGFARTFSDYAEDTINYLNFDGEPDSEAQDLINRFKTLASRYGGLSKMKKSQDIQNYLQNQAEQIESFIEGYINGDSNIINANTSSTDNKIDIELIYPPFECLSRNNDVKTFVYQVHISGNSTFLRLKEAYFIQGNLYYRIPDDIKFSEDIFREVSDKEFRIYGKYDYPDGYGIYEGFDAEFGKMLSSVDMALRDCSRRYDMLKELARESLIDYYGDYYVASTKKSQSIHTMIADIRNNNNSLKKSRIDISIERK